MHSLKPLILALVAALAIPSLKSQAAFPTVALKKISDNELFGPTNISVANDGSGRLFVCDQFGQIRIIQGGSLLPTPFLDISSKIVPLTATYDERGLLGLAFHPNYANSALPGYRKFYVFYSAASPNARGNPSAVGLSLTVSAISTGNPCTVTTASPHGLVPGNSVTIAGVTGGTFTTSINGVQPVTIVNSTSFTVPVECTSNVGITAPGTASYAISSVATGSPCVITTPAPHGLANGNWAVISGVTGGTFSTTINTLHSITLIDATHFSVPVNCTSNASVTGGSIARSLPAPVNCRTTISEFQVTGNANIANPSSERVLLTFDKPQSNHDGGQLEFGPDGFLYFSAGDGGGSNDTGLGHAGAANSTNTAVAAGNLGNGQDKTSLLGKIHRIDPLGNNGLGGQYGIPATNPFVGVGGGVRQEIYAYGLRNTWRFSFDVGTGGTGRLFAADVGQNKVEEVDIIVKGGNYGWHAKEGAFTFDAGVLTALTTGGTVRVDTGLLSLPGGETLIDPIAQYAHPGTVIGSPALPQIGISIAGGYVYRGSAIPALQGKYVFGDYSTTGGATSGAPNGIFVGIEETSPGNWTPTPTVLDVLGGNPIPARVYSFGRGEDGELYVAAKTTIGPKQLTAGGLPSGIIYKIVPLQSITTSLPVAKDNTIFSEDATNSTFTSDALGYLFVGNTSFASRRALIAFDLSSVPAGTVIQSAKVKLALNKSGPSASGSTLSLHRLSQTWGEGTSVNAAGLGVGAEATLNDATWARRFYNTLSWTTPGGTYNATASATAATPAAGSIVTWGPTAQLKSDVQGWLTTPASNAGWILIGNEAVDRTACRFDSKDFPGTPPALEITYDGPPVLTNRERWIQTYFSAGHYVDDLADLDGDATVNLFEYAFNLSPSAVNAADSGLQVATQDADPDTIAFYSFRRDPRATDLDYYLEESSNLVTWAIVAQSIGGAAATGSIALSESPIAEQEPVSLVQAAETVTTPSNRFVRLRVVRHP